jgi:hypothetical protein
VIQRLLFIVSLLSLALLFVACGAKFQDNPHGPAYLFALTPAAQGPVVPPTQGKLLPHFTNAGFGASLQALRDQYGAPTGLSRPPVYAFNYGPPNSPRSAQLLVTMQDGQAVEFSYVPQHPMSYQEGEAFAVKLLPDDAAGPTTVQQESDDKGTCLAQTFKSTFLAQLFPKTDFLSPNGKDDTPGAVTVNFYPNLQRYSDNQTVEPNTAPLDHNTVSSVLVNLGTRPSC